MRPVEDDEDGDVARVGEVGEQLGREEEELRALRRWRDGAGDVSGTSVHTVLQLRQLHEEIDQLELYTWAAEAVVGALPEPEREYPFNGESAALNLEDRNARKDQSRAFVQKHEVKRQVVAEIAKQDLWSAISLTPEGMLHKSAAEVLDRLGRPFQRERERC